VRIVRSPEGTIAVDPTGRANGRGTYLCLADACWQTVMNRGILAEQSHATIDPATRESLMRAVAEVRGARASAARARNVREERARHDTVGASG